jgi:hypothetical protein
VKGEFVGGSDIVREMYQSGELQQLHSERGIAHKAARGTNFASLRESPFPLEGEG